MCAPLVSSLPPSLAPVRLPPPLTSVRPSSALSKAPCFRRCLSVCLSVCRLAERASRRQHRSPSLHFARPPSFLQQLRCSLGLEGTPHKLTFSSTYFATHLAIEIVQPGHSITVLPANLKFQTASELPECGCTSQSHPKQAASAATIPSAPTTHSGTRERERVPPPLRLFPLAALPSSPGGRLYR